MLIAASPVPLSFPGNSDLVGILPELVLGGAFLLLMLLDLVIPASRRSWLAGFALLGIAGAFAITVWCWFNANPGRLVYSGSFAYDRFALFVDAILLVSAGLVVMISPHYLNRRGLHYGEYYALILAATLGMMLLAGASSLMVIFLAIELLSLALYVLSGFARHEERSQEAALKYLLLGGFASGFLLFGMALIYGETGHTQLAQIAAAVQSSSKIDPLLLAGVLLLFVGFAFKVSAAPFHSWTPDVYQGAPTSVTTFMSVATKVAAFAALVRVFTYTFEGAGNHYYSNWEPVVALVAIASMVIGNVAALTQTSVKRMLAYSGIAQAGYILIGVAVGAVVLPGGQASSDGTIAVLYYLAAYAVSNIGAFAVITIMAGRGEDLDSYDGLRGLAHRRPVRRREHGAVPVLAGWLPADGGILRQVPHLHVGDQRGPDTARALGHCDKRGRRVLLPARRTDHVSAPRRGNRGIPLVTDRLLGQRGTRRHHRGDADPRGPDRARLHGGDGIAQGTDRVNEELAKRFAEITGAKGVAGDVVSPPDLGALAAVARICDEQNLGMRVTSGAPPASDSAPSGGIVISLQRLNAIEVAAGGLTVRAGAGATVAHLRDAVAKQKLGVVGLGAQTGSAHVGTVVARGEVARRALAGVEAVLSTGESVKAGGAVLKDVVGYDLLSVMLGSAGRLAVIAAVTFRLEPAAAKTPTAKPPGAVAWQPALAAAFDPKGLLRPAASP